MAAERYLTLSRDLVRTSADTFWMPSQGRQIKLGPAVMTLGYQFAVPATVAAVAAGLGVSADEIAHAVTELEGLGVLIAQKADDSGEKAGNGIFRSPMVSIADAINAADVVFFGVPYDVGTTYRPGARFGPDYLRRTSGALFQYAAGNGYPPGMWDPVRKRRVLPGVRLADTGDINVGSVLTRNAEAFTAVEQLTARITEAGRLPVMIGGDHSVTLAAIRGVLNTHKRLGVIHIDAHADYDRARNGDWRAEVHHGNFMGWVIGDERVSRVLQAGIRQLTASDTKPDGKVVRWSGRSAALAPVDEVLAGLPDDIPYYVTVDVDGVDPAFIPSTGTPLPGGFSPAELVHILEAVCSRRKIAGLDLVELIVDPSDSPGLICADIVLRAVDAAMSAVR